MPKAKKYRTLAARQRHIAKLLPFLALRKHFIDSAERFELLAQAHEELSRRREG